MVEPNGILFLIRGFPATGKSTLSLHLAKKLKCVILDKDVIQDEFKEIEKLINKDNNLKINLNDHCYPIL